MASENAPRDANHVPTVLLESSTNPGVVFAAKGDEATGRLLVDIASASGTVTSVSVVTANGISGSVANPTTTPAITLTLGAITPSAVQISGLTISQIVGTDASKNLVSLDTATYPSLTELSYVKGVTSAIQTQINAKGSGTVTAVSIATANGFSGSSTGGATPALTIIAGAITPTTVNGLTISSSTGVLTITNAKTLAVTNSLTLSGTDSTIMTFPSTSATIARIDAGQTFTGINNFTSPDVTTSITTTSVSFTAFAGATTLLTIGGTGASASLFAPSTLDTSSSITGAIRTSGGISAAKSANIGTTITVGTGYQIGGAAASGKILKGNGTNFVASTETYAAPGSSGNVMTSDGTNWTSATPASAGNAFTTTWGTIFETAGRFSAVTAGAGAVTFSTYGVQLATSATGTSSAEIHPAEATNGYGFNSRMTCFANLDTAPTTGAVFFGVMTQPSITGTAIDFTKYHYGFKVVYAASTATISATNADNTTESATTITGITTTNEMTNYEAKFTTGVNVKYYVDRVLKATITTNLPTAGTFAFPMQLAISNKATATNYIWRFHSYNYEEDAE